MKTTDPQTDKSLHPEFHTQVPLNPRKLTPRTQRFRHPSLRKTAHNRQIPKKEPQDPPAPLMPEVALVLLPPQKDDLSSRLQEDPISGSGASSFRTEAEKDCADCFRFEALAAWLSGLPAER